MALKQMGALFQHFYRWRWSASILLLFLLDFCTYMAFRDSGTHQRITHEDKLLHFLAFFTLFCVGHVSLHYDFRAHGGRWIAFGHMLCWLAYGGFIELGQRFISNRDASIYDLIFDAIGILIGFVIVSSMNLFPRSAYNG